MELKKGQKVKTRFGEELKVLDTKTHGDRMKKGEVVEKGKTYFLAKSGDHKCWFPAEYYLGSK